MRRAVGMELRALVSAWIVCLLVPLPAAVFWRSSEGRSAALGCFFVACVGLVAYCFSKEVKRSSGATPFADGSNPRLGWHAKILALGLATLLAGCATSAQRQYQTIGAGNQALVAQLKTCVTQIYNSPDDYRRLISACRQILD